MRRCKGIALRLRWPLCAGLLRLSVGIIACVVQRSDVQRFTLLLDAFSAADDPFFPGTGFLLLIHVSALLYQNIHVFRSFIISLRHFFVQKK